jgi:hypothetical protein
MSRRPWWHPVVTSKQMLFAQLCPGHAGDSGLSSGISGAERKPQTADRGNGGLPTQAPGSGAGNCLDGQHVDVVLGGEEPGLTGTVHSLSQAATTALNLEVYNAR